MEDECALVKSTASRLSCKRAQGAGLRCSPYKKITTRHRRGRVKMEEMANNRYYINLHRQNFREYHWWYSNLFLPSPSDLLPLGADCVHHSFLFLFFFSSFLYVSLFHSSNQASSQENQQRLGNEKAVLMLQIVCSLNNILQSPSQDSRKKWGFRARTGGIHGNTRG